MPAEPLDGLLQIDEGIAGDRRPGCDRSKRPPELVEDLSKPLRLGLGGGEAALEGAGVEAQRDEDVADARDG